MSNFTFTADQMKALRKKLGNTPVLTDEGSFISNHQNNGVEGEDSITLGEMFQLLDNSLLSQAPLVGAKVKAITTSLVSEGTLWMDPVIAEVEEEGGAPELASGRHRAEAIRQWIILSGRDPSELCVSQPLGPTEPGKPSVVPRIRVRRIRVKDRSALSRQILAHNSSRNMGLAEKVYIDCQVRGIADDYGSIMNGFGESEADRRRALKASVEKAVRDKKIKKVTGITAVALCSGVCSLLKKDHKVSFTAEESKRLLDYLLDGVDLAYRTVSESWDASKKEGDFNAGRPKQGRNAIRDNLVSGYLAARAEAEEKAKAEAETKAKAEAEAKAEAPANDNAAPPPPAPPSTPQPPPVPSDVPQAFKNYVKALGMEDLLKTADNLDKKGDKAKSDYIKKLIKAKSPKAGSGSAE